MIKIILASKSKVRKEILDKNNIPNQVEPSNVDEDIIKKFKEELFFLYQSKFGLINDHKLKIDELKINKIINLLEKKSEEKYNKGDFKGSIRALRRSEKYLAKKIVSV